MVQKTILTGASLIILGIVVSLLSDSGSVTSYIPSFIGVVFLVLGFVARAKPDLHHHVMHATAALALIAILASLGSLIGRGSTGWALFSQLATVAICAALLFAAVQSFRAARLARESA